MYSLPNLNSGKAMIGQIYILSVSVPCFLPEAIFGVLSLLLGSLSTMLPHANLSP